MATLNHRADPGRMPGWTLELVVRHGLGVLEDSMGGCYVVRLDGRASGPVRYTLDPLQFRDWFVHRNGGTLRGGRSVFAPKTPPAHAGLMTVNPRHTLA
ncbi:MAG TPA: hypothetical protein VHN99_02255 [Deinococcales bacterium]|nr:hypothetical protein [Deinococcales bacterium]